MAARAWQKAPGVVQILGLGVVLVGVVVVLPQPRWCGGPFETWLGRGKGHGVEIFLGARARSLQPTCGPIIG